MRVVYSVFLQPRTENFFLFFSSRRRHTSCLSDWSSDVCSSDLSDQYGIRKRLALRVAASAPVVPACDEVARNDRHQHHSAILQDQAGWRRPPSDAGCHWTGSFADTSSKWQSPFAQKDPATTRGKGSSVRV